MSTRAAVAAVAPTKDEVFDALVEDILTGRLSPGEPLIERVLADRFGISRTPIREVLQRLQAEYLVDYFPRQGAFVRKMSPQDVRELFEVREALEPLAAKLAAQHRPQAEASDFATQFADMQALERRPPDELILLGQSLHDTVVTWSGNRLLADHYRTVRKRTRLVRLMMRERKDVEIRSLYEHRAILEAILDQDSDEAYSLMQVHVQRSNVVAMELIMRR